MQENASSIQERGGKVLQNIDRREILRQVDHTLLAPTATWEELQVLCDEALQCGGTAGPNPGGPAPQGHGEEADVRV